MNASASPADSTRRASFDALIERLRRDGDAGLGYESLRRRLIQFFRLHVPAEADALADVVLDRLGRKIVDGVEIASIPMYALGIARMVLHEVHARDAQRHAAESDPVLLSEMEHRGAAKSAPYDEAAMAALAQCLDAMDSSARALILAYYSADGSERIASRQRLAAELGVSLNALRNRAQRLRDSLERCVRSRLGVEDET